MFNLYYKTRRVTLVSLVMLLTACVNPFKDSPETNTNPLKSLDTNWAAHWLRPNVMLVHSDADTLQLVSSSNASFDETGQYDVFFELKGIPMPEGIIDNYPHLSDFKAYEVSVTPEQVRLLLKSQLAVVDLGAGTLSYVQTADVLDALYTQGAQDADEVDYLGAQISGEQTRFALWAPTAKSIKLRLYDAHLNPIEHGIMPMIEDPATGVWSTFTHLAPQGQFYRYQVELYHPRSQNIEIIEVTDPYSLSLSTNSRYSQVVDLNSPATQPEGWQQQTVATLNKPEDLILYEVHIRDFSASDSALDAQKRGKYAAFSADDSYGVRHLKRLREAGLNTIHLLPTYDISTVNEDPEQVIQLDDSVGGICQRVPGLSLCTKIDNPKQSLKQLLSQFPTNSDSAQAMVEQIRPYDGFNWGYDPFHYTVPEGGYAQNPNGIERLVEFRQMVKSLHDLDFRVVLDVVYNHTYASGLADKSVLDKIVPNYYHRLNPISGAIEQSTCCENSATERRMMAKLMIDSLVVWARDYHIDGFRFDLMGHQPKSVMLAAREAVRQVDPDTYFYGEGWNFGEVANNARFVQATQVEMAGSEIGTYTDRLRDAVRGGSSFVSGNEIRMGQGIGNGLLHLPNELHSEETLPQVQQEYGLSLDQIRVGLTGNLANYPLINRQGQSVLGKDIDYDGAPTGYALDPADTINYVSKHDNQTLWDNNQYRIANSVSIEDRVRMQILSLSYPILAQGIPFLHMGSELLRSKSFLRDSYDYSDWFNAVDFSMQSNFYDVGLPPADKDQANWQVIQTLLENNQGRDKAQPADIQKAVSMFLDLVAIRSDSPLFRLSSEQEIIQRLKFHNMGASQQAGLIVMELDDRNGEELDPKYESIVVLFNHSGTTQLFPFAGAEGYQLHPILQKSVDLPIRNASASSEGFNVPALSTLVFVK